MRKNCNRLRGSYEACISPEQKTCSDKKDCCSDVHDAYTSSEIQTYEDLGLCRDGEGGRFVESGIPFLPGLDYGLELPQQGQLPVNPSVGLLACGHPVGATGLMQAVFAFWQLQGAIGQHLNDGKLQVRNAKRGLIHSHAGTGTYISASILQAT